MGSALEFSDEATISEQWRVELQYKISILLLLTLTVILYGCDFFATRNLNSRISENLISCLD